jgi:hypothetical protein
MLHYILSIFTLLLLVYFAYIKLKYPFWNIQPVYHTYDVFRRLYREPFIINVNRPRKTKFYEPIYVKTKPYVDIKESSKKQLVNAIQCFYISTDRILHTITDDDLGAYLTGQSELSYISMYYETVYQQFSDLSGSRIVTNYTPIGSITSRKLNFWYVNPYDKNKTNYVEMPTYYIDYLCVDRKKEKANVYRKLLQSHEYNCRIENPAIVTSVIKKEIELFEGIVPFVKYYTYTYKLRDNAIFQLPKHYYVIQITNENLDHYVDFFYSNNDYCSKTKLYDILVFPDVGNIQQMISQKLLYIYCLKSKTNLYGFYFFKDAKMYYEDMDMNTLQFSASVMNCLSPMIFYTGYLHSLQDILKKDKTKTMLLFENIGHNSIILKEWNKKYSPIFSNKTAYYTYNFVHPSSPVSLNRIFILN